MSLRPSLALLPPRALPAGSSQRPTRKTKRRKLDSLSRSTLPHPNRVPATATAVPPTIYGNPTMLASARNTRRLSKRDIIYIYIYSTHANARPPRRSSLKFTLFLRTQISEYYSTKTVPDPLLRWPGV